MSPALPPRRDMVLGLLACAAASGAKAQEAAPARPVEPAVPAVAEATLTLEELVVLDLREDDQRRMRVPVTVNGRGPFPFVVDTGADHSVLSEELARVLRLPPAGMVRVNGIAGPQLRPQARVDRLELGGRWLDHAAVPLLLRGDLGALGLVGLDLLAEQRLDIDFERRRMEVRRSHALETPADAIVVRGKSRFGRLILVDSTVRRQPVYVVLDTGAQDAIGNGALRALLDSRRGPRRGKPETVQLQSATGAVVEGEVDEMEELTLGGVLLHRTPLIVAPLHTFEVYRLADEPALMLGMSVLRAFRRVTVDFGRREVSFQLPAQGVA